MPVEPRMLHLYCAEWNVHWRDAVTAAEKAGLTDITHFRNLVTEVEAERIAGHLGVAKVQEGEITDKGMIAEARPGKITGQGTVTRPTEHVVLPGQTVRKADEFELAQAEMSTPLGEKPALTVEAESYLRQLSETIDALSSDKKRWQKLTKTQRYVLVGASVTAKEALQEDFRGSPASISRFLALPLPKN